MRMKTVDEILFTWEILQSLSFEMETAFDHHETVAKWQTQKRLSISITT